MVASVQHLGEGGGGGSRVACREVDSVCRWEVAATSVDMSLAVLRQIEFDWRSLGYLCIGHEEAGGLLRGERLSDGAKGVRVQKVESYCSTGLHHVLGMRKSRLAVESEPEPVGFYRVDVSGRGLSERDTAMMREKFTAPNSIGLVIQRNSAAVMLLRTEEGLGAAEIAFPLRIEAPQQSPTAAIPVIEGEARRGPAIPRRWLGIAAISLCVLVSAWLYRPRQPLPDERGASGVRNAANLGLAATRHGNSVQFAWNRQAPDLMRASEGVFSVTDGALRTTTHLTAAELDQGTFWYFPVSPNIQGQLEVVRADGRRVSESLTVLAPTASTPESAAVPLPPPRQQLAARTPAPAPLRPLVLSQAPTEEPRRNIELPDAVPIALPSKPSDLPPLVQGMGSLPRPPAPPSAPPTTTPTAPSPISPAKATVYPRPIVPPEVKAMISHEIEVAVRLQIDAEGRVTSAQPIGPEGSLARTLGRIAADTARLWEFEPGRQDGRPVATVMTIQFKFGPVKR